MYSTINSIIVVTNGNVIKEGRNLCCFLCRFFNKLFKSIGLVYVTAMFYMIWNWMP